MTEVPTAARYEPISIGDKSTVVAEFILDGSREAAYQSEAELEAAFIELLQGQAYEYLRIPSESALLANLRAQLEALNTIEFGDEEWQRFFAEKIAGANEGLVEKTARIQEDHVQVLERDDGTFKNVLLIDKRNIHNNRLQVINQYQVGLGAAERATRYDVTILVNGLPLVHVELKRRGVAIREAFNQINRYQRDSFWSGSGLFEYVQLFVISNGTRTKYYSNTTRASHVAEQAGGRSKRKTSNTFEFTSWWADAPNRAIADLTGFTKTFFAKHTLLSILTRYCVFDSDRKLLVMRPYQIAATERILQRIETSTNHRQLGSTAAGGYVWHTTGSGKTLTSFKAAQLASRLQDVDKVVFVVDRKDIDYQTMREYERFEKGAANSNRLDERAQAAARGSRRADHHHDDPEARPLRRSEQGPRDLRRARRADLRRVPSQPVRRHARRDRRRRSSATTCSASPARRSSPRTPARSGNPRLRTTEQAFGDRLHTYTIVDAINDRNVLPFRLDYVNTIKLPDQLADKQVSAIDTERALLAPRADQPDRRLHSRALRPEDQAQLRVHPGRQAARRLQLAIRDGVDRRREALLRGVREAAGRAAGGAAAQGRAHLQLRRERGRPRLPGRGGVRDRTTSTRARATSSKGRSPTTTRCSARASTPHRTGSRTTTRISRCDSGTVSSTSRSSSTCS